MAGPDRLRGSTRANTGYTNASESKLIKFDDVTKKYGTNIDVSRKRAMREIVTPSRMRSSAPRLQEAIALQDLSFDLVEGETLLVLGFEGSGKTTLARLICELTQPTTGRVVVQGKTRLVTNQTIGATPVMRLREYTRLLCMMLGADSSSLPETIETILNDCHLERWKDVRVHNAPDGAVKRLGFYASLLIDADIYVFDKLLTLRGESGELRERIDARVHQILETKTAVVLTKLAPPELLPDQVIVLHRGSSIFQGDPALGISAYDRLNRRTLEVDETRKDDEIDRAADFLASVSETPRDEAERIAWDFDVSLKENHRLQEISDSGKPILVGPYLGSFDTELLLWIPFLRWALRTFKIPRERVTCLSRGGAEAWYEGVGNRYIDAFELTSVYQQRYEKRVGKAGLRQIGVEPFDRLLYRRGIRNMGVANKEEADWLHPSLFLRLAMAAWKGEVEPSFLTNKLVMEPLSIRPDDGSGSPAQLHEGSGIPSRPYIAVWFGLTPYLLRGEAIQIVPRVLADLAREAILVDVATGKVLEPPFETVLPLENASPVEQGYVSDREHLQRITQIIGGAEVFFSAHGGLSYLGPLQNVPSVTVYSDPANYRPVPKGWTAVNFKLSALLVESLTGSVPLALDAARVSGEELLAAVRSGMS